MNKAAFSVLASLLCLCGSDASPTGQQASSGQLYLSVVTQDYVSVLYADQSGSGIKLTVKPSGFSVMDMQGRSIVNMEDQFYQVKTMTYRMIEIKGESFLQEVGVKDKSEYYLNPKDIKSFKSSFYLDSNVKGLDQILSQAKSKHSSSVHLEKLHQSVKALLEDPHSQLLVDAAIALGEEGVTGYDYPVMLQFYMTALRLRALFEDPTEPSEVAKSTTGSDHGDNKTCLDYCPPCKERGCYGMCGRECDCWSWVCSDCCFQQGCYDHSHCCQDKPYSFACLFPWNFSCNSYEC